MGVDHGVSLYGWDVIVVLFVLVVYSRMHRIFIELNCHNDTTPCFHFAKKSMSVATC